MKRLHKIPSLFFSLLLITISIIFVIIPYVKADTEYNWIQNNGFESGSSNILLNSGFEYGNTTAWGTDGIIDSNAYSGFYALKLYFPYTCYASQSFTNTSVNDIEEFSAYMKTNGVMSTYLRVQYNDSSIDNYECVLTSSYVKYSFPLEELDAGKFVSQFYIAKSSATGSPYAYVDSCAVIISGYGTGQTDFNATTLPWWSGQDNPFTGINQLLGHESQCSAYMGWSNYMETIAQDIGFLDSDTVTNASLWLYTDGAADVTFNIQIVYTDRSTTRYTTEPFNSADGWIEVNFASIVLPNKVIFQLQLFGTQETVSQYVFIDDVRLMASVPYGQCVFSWELSPEPTGRTNLTFSAYQGVGYVFTGYVYDENGVINATGTFSYTTGYGSGSGSINGGTFSFQLVARASFQTITESIVINIVSDTQNMTTKITATWEYTGFATPPPTTGEEGWYTNIIVQVMVFFLLIMLIPLVFAIELKNHINPAITFSIGLVIMLAIGFKSGFLDLWFLFLGIMIIIVLFLNALGIFRRVQV